MTRTWEKGAYFNVMQTSSTVHKIAIKNLSEENVCRNVTEQLWHAQMVCSPIGDFFSDNYENSDCPCESNCPDGCSDCPNIICKNSILVLNTFSFNQPILIKPNGEVISLRS